MSPNQIWMRGIMHPESDLCLVNDDYGVDGDFPAYEAADSDSDSDISSVRVPPLNPRCISEDSWQRISQIDPLDDDGAHGVRHYLAVRDLARM